jgi:L-ectoine synthase
LIIRDKENVKVVDWGNGLSYRFLVESDGMGFTIAHTVVRAGSGSRLKYDRHLEACYCIGGKGEVITRDGAVHLLEPGVLYALDKNDAHTLMAAPSEDLHLISVFSPALTGEEKHNLTEEGFSGY